MSSFRRGGATATGLMAAGALGFAVSIIVVDAHLRLSDDALSAMAQIGSTLLVAYALEMSWFVKESKSRGSGRESWVGFVTGIGLCSVFGIAMAVLLIGHQGPSSFIEALAAMWAIFSLGFLGILVATLPYLLYDLSHTVHTEYSDE